MATHKLGDLLRYRVGDAEHVGEVVETDPLVCHYLEPTASNAKVWTWALGEHYPDRVLQRFPVNQQGPRLTRQEVKNVWRRAGFCVGVDLFCRLEDEDDVELELHPDDSDEEDEDEDDDSQDSMVVEDRDGERFRLGPASDAFVADTHAAVRAWHAWAPTNPSERRAKDFVDGMAGRHAHAEADRAFVEDGAAAEPVHFPPP